MEPRLAKLISEYQERVAIAVSMLEDAGFSRPSSYFKHGIGCAVGGPPWRVDFDFGERGQIDGFNTHRLYKFAERRLAEYGFASADEIESAVEDAHNAGPRVDRPLLRREVGRLLKVPRCSAATPEALSTQPHFARDLSN